MHKQYVVEKTTQGKIWSLDFGSVDEMIRSIKTMSVTNPENRRDYFRVTSGALCSRGNFGFNNIAEIEQGFRCPSTDMVRDIYRYVDLLRKHVELPESRRRRVVRRVDDGCEIDVDRWLRREPTMFDDVRGVASPSRTCRVGVNISVNSGEARSNMYERVAAVVALAELLTEHGVGVQVDMLNTFEKGCMSYSGSPNYSWDFGVITLCVKDFSEPMDMVKLAFVAGEITVYRRLFFSAKVQAAIYKVPTYLSRPVDCPERLEHKYDILMPKLRSEKQVVSFIKAQFAKFAQKEPKSC